MIFSPYTYTAENFYDFKDKTIAKRNEIFAFGLMIGPLSFFYFASRRVRINRAKTEYYLNQMMKRKFIADELELKPRKMRLNELK
jgi:hypothetical protein